MVSTESNTSGSRTKAIWDSETVELFINLCVAEVEAKNRPGTTFSKLGWDNLLNNISLETNRTYTKIQVKNKWDALKGEWKLWKQLIGKETGLGWNDRKKTVDASDDWWRSKIETNPNFAKFRKEGITPEMEEKLDTLFMNIVATGEYKYSSTSNVHEYETLDAANNDSTLLESSDESDECNIKEQKDKQPLKLGSKVNKFKKTDGKKKVGGSAKLSLTLDNLVETIKGRGDTTYIVRKEKTGTSIAEVMKVVTSLPGVGTGSPLWYFATRLFLNSEKREMFATIDDPYQKISWLNYEFSFAN